MANPARLNKRLTLFDVYVISTGAMFSSGFFLLPGLATAGTGTSVVLAYFLSGVLIVPALLSKAELATAMPKAGGTYYYLDRTLGPLVGTVGGIGTWLTLMLKSAFALIGMGAYLSLFFDVPMKPMAIGFTLLFVVINIVGVHGSSRFLRVLVIALITILVFFTVHGLAETIPGLSDQDSPWRTDPFLKNGVDGLLGTVGLVFVSYIGLTKVASLAEEVRDPDRNIPMGMILALVTVTALYVVGAFVMLSVLGTEGLSGSLTPVADAAGSFSNWVPSQVWVILMVAAAVAAFTSMANAGILSASRYPLAMARDRLLPESFSAIGRFQTPVRSILLTCGVLIVLIVVLDVEQVAKLASALQLAIFGLVNVAVIVMRESQIEAYDPGFRSPFYPWVQLAGIVVPLLLVAEMGWLPVLFTLGVIGLGVAWYQYYARDRIAREGAIFHVFARLGRRRFAGLDRELRDLMKEKGLRAEDPFDEVVARAQVIDVEGTAGLGDLVIDASALLGGQLKTSPEDLAGGFHRGLDAGGTAVARGAAILHTRISSIDSPEMVLARVRGGMRPDVGDETLFKQCEEEPVHAVFFVVSGTTDAGSHLRLLAQLAGRIEDTGFLSEWLANVDEQELKETLLRDDRYLALKLETGAKSEALIGRSLKELDMPEGSLVALIRRYGVTMVPRGRTVLRESDRLTIIGDPMGLQTLDEKYGDGRS